MKTKLQRYISYLIMGGLFYLLGTWLVSNDKINISTLTWIGKENQSEIVYQPSYTYPKEQRIVLIYIGSSSCYACNIEDLPTIIERAKIQLAEKIDTANTSYSVKGIAKDWRINNGLKHLKKFGMFDQIETGDSWANDGIIKYVWQQYPGEPATPQILVVHRSMNLADGEGERFSIEEERVLVRKVGYEEIRLWTEQGNPIPSF
jgi:hypothetical protein